MSEVLILLGVILVAAVHFLAVYTAKAAVDKGWVSQEEKCNEITVPKMGSIPPAPPPFFPMTKDEMVHEIERRVSSVKRKSFFDGIGAEDMRSLSAAKKIPHYDVPADPPVIYHSPIPGDGNNVAYVDFKRSKKNSPKKDK